MADAQERDQQRPSKRETSVPSLIADCSGAKSTAAFARSETIGNSVAHARADSEPEILDLPRTGERDYQCPLRNSSGCLHQSLPLHCVHKKPGLCDDPF